MSLKKNRWYDSRPDVAKSIQLLTTFPQEIQSIIAQGMIDMANQEFQAAEVLKSYKSLGTEKIMGLHKSQNKARDIDQNPEAFKAVTYMYVLPEEQQKEMAKRLVEIGNYIYQYFKSCNMYSEEPGVEEIRGITETYINNGSEDAQKFLAAIEHIFYQRDVEDRKFAHTVNNEEIEEDAGGMKITD